MYSTSYNLIVSYFLHIRSDYKLLVSKPNFKSGKYGKNSGKSLEFF